MKVEELTATAFSYESAKERSRCVTRILSETPEEASIFRGKIASAYLCDAIFQRETHVLVVRGAGDRTFGLYKILSSRWEIDRYVV